MNTLTRNTGYTVETRLPVMSQEKLRLITPALFAERAASTVSSKYKFYDTYEILEALQDHGWKVYKAFMARTRIEEKQGFQKHMLWLRHKDAEMSMVGDTMFGLALVNDHSGGASYQLHVNMLTLRCLNGMMASNEYIPPVRIPHTKLTTDAVIDAQFEILSEIPKLGLKVKEAKEIDLSPREREILAHSAMQLRWQPEINEQTGEIRETAPIRAPQLLTLNRREDREDENSLFRTTNIIQENIIRGRLPGRTQTGSRTTTRAVNSVNEDIRLNKALFTLMEQMGKLKQES